MFVLLSVGFPALAADPFPGPLPGEEIIAAGHEIAHHGYTHEAPLPENPGMVAEEIDRGLETLDRLFGVRRGRPGRLGGPLLLLILSRQPLPEPDALELAGRSLRDLVDYQEASRHLERRQPFGGETPKLQLGRF